MSSFVNKFGSSFQVQALRPSAIFFIIWSIRVHLQTFTYNPWIFQVSIFHDFGREALAKWAFKINKIVKIKTGNDVISSKLKKKLWVLTMSIKSWKLCGNRLQSFEIKATKKVRGRIIIIIENVKHIL